MIEIKTGDIPCCVYISDVEDHYDVKNRFLKFLSLNNIHSTKGIDGDEIFNTDYYVKEHPTTNNKYYEIVDPVFNKHNEALCKILKYENPIKTWNMWFQQYKKGDSHSWHRHLYCIFSNIYYVDLPEGASKTRFRFLGREFTVDVKEGQIITFPSFLEHCSKPNPSEKFKTVISFNSS